MTNSVENHLRPIINNVVDNFPYYNRSSGHDHFLVYPYDFGVLCSGRYLREDWREIDDCQVDDKLGHKYFCHVSRIINTSFIGNYGMDYRYYHENEYSFGLNKCIGNCPKVICHRPNVDIVTPQYLTSDTHECLSDLERVRSIYIRREYDSCFKGNYRYQRFILEKMKKNASYNLKYNLTDRYMETDDLLKCVFAYHMCGQACWSLRLYDALALGSIPVIVADGAIQAFERYLDWRKFSVKISVDELFQDRFTFRFRKLLRKQSDLFRRNVMKYTQTEDDVLLPINDSTSIRNTVRSDKRFGFVLDKMLNTRRAIEWFNFRDLRKETNAFRMIVLEMYCRKVRQRKSTLRLKPNDLLKEFQKVTPSKLANDKRFQDYICSRRSDFIARLRYVKQ